MDLASWTLGITLIVVTIAIHSTAVVFMAFGLESRVRRERQGLGLSHAVPTVIGRIAAVSLALTVLHGLEGVLWAVAYRGLGAFDSFTQASVYALATMTTFEISGVTLPPRFHMISALEGVNGVLLFGISTAFLFAVIQVHWQSLSHRRHPAADPGRTSGPSQ